MYIYTYFKKGLIIGTIFNTPSQTGTTGFREKATTAASVGASVSAATKKPPKIGTPATPEIDEQKEKEKKAEKRAEARRRARIAEGISTSALAADFAGILERPSAKPKLGGGV